MGLSISKSPLERRNSVARRSQRRKIHSLKSRVDKISQEIHKFRGTEDDEKYKELTNEIYRIHKELTSKTRDLQPQVKNIHQLTVTKLEDASRALENKIMENREKAIKKQAELQEKHKQKEEKSKKKVDKKEESDEDDDEITEVNENVEDVNHETYEEHEASQLANSGEKRQTVELNFIQVIPDSTVEVDIHSELSSPKMKSAEEKRKSILKMGVPVMPGVIMSEMTKKLSIVAPEDDPHGSSNDHLDIIKDIEEELAAIEYQIADFLGKKNGTQYNRIKDKLNSYYNEVGRMNTRDDYTLEQISLCKNYIKSCLTFLDEKAVDDKNTNEKMRFVENKEGVKNKKVDSNNKSHDDVFLVENNNLLSQHEVNLKLQKLTKTTAI